MDPRSLGRFRAFGVLTGLEGDVAWYPRNADVKGYSGAVPKTENIVELN